MKPLHLALLVGMNCLWAPSYSMFKLVQAHLNPGQLTTLRFGLAAAVVLLCWPRFQGNAPRGRDLWRTILMGVVVFVLAPRLQVAGLQRGQAADASVLMALDPLIASVGAAIFLKEHIGPRRWLGFLLGLVGMVVMAEIWRPDFHWPGLAANALFLLSLFCETSYSLLGKPIFPRANLFKILGVAIVSGTLVNLVLDGPATLAVVVHLPAKIWAMIAYLTLICTVLGYSLWFVVIREAEVNVAALTVFLQPVISLLFSVCWLKESLRWGQLWGSLLILAGLALGLSRQLRRRIAPAT